MEEDIDSTFVIDASYILSFLMPDEQSPEAVFLFESFRKQRVNLITTTLLPYEVTNSLSTNVLRKRISPKMAMSLLTRFELLSIPTVAVDTQNTLMLSLKHNISSYDASYVALCRGKGVTLLTFDEKLQKLAKTK